MLLRCLWSVNVKKNVHKDGDKLIKYWASKNNRKYILINSNKSLSDNKKKVLNKVIQLLK